MKRLLIYPAEIFVVLVSMLVYFLVFFNLNTTIDEAILFSTPDSQTYWDVVTWMKGGEANYGLSIRPVLYPFLLLISSTIAGIYGIWALQFILWVGTALLIFLAVRKVTKSLVFGLLAVALFVSNVSLIALTLHGLTEVVSTFFLAAFALFILKNIDRRRELYFIHGVVLFLVLMTILKPVFLLPLEFVVFLVLPILYGKKYWQNARQLIRLVLLLTPLFLQLCIMKVHFGEFSVSKISDITLVDYIFTQGMMEVEGGERIPTKVIAQGMTKAERKDYVLAHKEVYYKCFKDNIRFNIDAIPLYLKYPIGYENYNLLDYMVKLNRKYFKMHKVFVLLGLLSLMITLLFKDFQRFLEIFLLGGLLAYFILTTGVSSMQGDRLVLPSIGLWPIVYLLVLSTLKDFSLKSLAWIQLKIKSL